MAVKVVTDSGCDYTQQEAARRAIEIVPMRVLVDGDVLRDGVDIDRAQFYTRLKSAKTFPETEPPSVADYSAVFSRLTSGGDDVVCITLSAELSKSFAHASAAAGSFAGRVVVVDSHSAAAAMVLMCDYALELAAGGAEAAAIAERLGSNALKRATFFAVPDVTPLGRSGRLPKALVALGSMLGVSLVLKIDDRGAIGPAGQSRSFERTCDIMVDALARSMDRSAHARVAISHAEQPELASTLARELEQKFGHAPAALTIHGTSATLAAHLGLGAIGVFGLLP